MGATALRQLLKSLCLNHKWKYAVYWKLSYEYRQTLSWEDGYCNSHKDKDAAENMSGDAYCKQFTDYISFNHGTRTHRGSAAYPIELAVANMFSLSYSLGEGIVGEVACKGEHCWFFDDSKYYHKSFFGNFRSMLLSKYKDELTIQFAAGIKTILFVPVSGGVVQLGSLEMIAEDMRQVTYLEDLFGSFISDISPSILSWNPLLSSRNSPVDSSTVLSNIFLDEPSTFGTSEITQNNSPTISPACLPISTISVNPYIPEFMQYTHQTDIYPFSGEIIQESINNMLPMHQNEFSFILEQPTRGHSGYIYGDENDRPISMGEVIQHETTDSSEFSNFTVWDSCENYVEPNINYDYDVEDIRNIWDQFSEKESNNGINPQDASELFSGGQAIIVDEYDSPYLINLEETIDDIGLVSEWNVCLMERINEGEDLSLSSTDPCGIYDEYQSKGLSNSGSPNTSSEEFGASCQTVCDSQHSKDDLCPLAYIKSEVSPKQGEEIIGHLSTGSISKSTSILTTSDNHKRERENVTSKKGLKSHLTGNKRVKTNELQRVRPRDRQMIQDRVKELRELIPNGDKCSIDSLLARTVKHMLFLQSVTNQAEKLRQFEHQEIVTDGDPRNQYGSSTQGMESCWPFVLGSQHPPYPIPIVIENLDQQGHILIEMFCEEHNHFLEIAQAIRHLNLTILKGRMEKKSDKMLAHFIIEAPRGFQKVDLLCPLMQLFQRNRGLYSKPSSLFF